MFLGTLWHGAHDRAVIRVDLNCWPQLRLWPKRGIWELKKEGLDNGTQHLTSIRRSSAVR